MQYFAGTREFQIKEPTAVTIGKFDGLHRHGLMKAAARKRHPRFIISRKAIPRLFTYKKRKEERP